MMKDDEQACSAVLDAVKALRLEMTLLASRAIEVEFQPVTPHDLGAACDHKEYNAVIKKRLYDGFYN